MRVRWWLEYLADTWDGSAWLVLGDFPIKEEAYTALAIQKFNSPGNIYRVKEVKYPQEQQS